MPGTNLLDRAPVRNNCVDDPVSAAQWQDALIASHLVLGPKLVGVCIASRAGSMGAAMLTPKDIMAMSRLSKPAVFLAIHMLADRGYVEIVRGAACGRGQLIVGFKLRLPTRKGGRA